VWLCEQGVPQSNWTPPDATFRWVSGTQGENLGGNLGGLFQQHLGNDLGFLVNRPYFMGYQATAQSIVASGSAFTTATLDTTSGYIHATDVGDNWSGWNAGSNSYTAQTAGWYLVTGEMFGGSVSSSGPVFSAALLPSTSGGVTPSQTPDIYQQQLATTNNNIGAGAAIFGLQYLNVGESITPQMRGQGYSGTFSTLAGSKNSGQYNSHMELVWLSE
jgi:hypothetical protein